MPCTHPMPACKTHAGIVTFDHRKFPSGKQSMLIPCGTCLGCKRAKAKEWALRCMLELHEHDSAAFTTLTYDDDHLPRTLERNALQRFMRNIRKAKRRKATKPIRFFASGEYGEDTQRPHYHAILFGCDATMDEQLIDRAWKQGITKTLRVTPAAIAYVAGYVDKKINDRNYAEKERIDYTTGEVYKWQQPFLQMSRKPGIAGNARRHIASWQEYAILNGTKIPVPKYLHQAWRNNASNDEIEIHEHTKYLNSLTKERMTTRMLEAAEQIEQARQNLQQEKRKKL